jgi:hypothetical protein
VRRRAAAAAATAATAVTASVSVRGGFRQGPGQRCLLSTFVEVLMVWCWPGWRPPVRDGCASDGMMAGLSMTRQFLVCGPLAMQLSKYDHLMSEAAFATTLMLRHRRPPPHKWLMALYALRSSVPAARGRAEPLLQLAELAAAASASAAAGGSAD